MFGGGPTDEERQMIAQKNAANVQLFVFYVAALRTGWYSMLASTITMMMDMNTLCSHTHYDLYHTSQLCALAHSLAHSHSLTAAYVIEKFF